jgi:xanthine dehydrogenase accessory factor
MISSALTRTAHELSEKGSPYVVATVVRVERPTSVTPGDAALVHDDGTIEGFVGGVCAQHSVRLYSLQAMESGMPLLLRIRPDADHPVDDEDDPSATEEDPSRTEEVGREDGTVTVQNPCLSGGALEVFLEPVLPMPRVVLAGESPIVSALGRLGGELGLAIVSDGEPSVGDLALVVAAHGRDELGVLQAGLEAGVPYIGLVASRKRGAAVIGQLQDLGVDRELLAQIDTPAGIDIGAQSAAEIAVSILARLVEVRRREDVVVTPRTRPETAVDPICGMTVVVGADTPVLIHAGQPIYFCCLGCKLTFEERHGDPLAAG